MAGNFLHVPLLGGTTENEGDIFVVGEELLATGVVVPDITEIVADLETQVRSAPPSQDTVFPDISPRPDIRAYHASEIPVVFGTMPAPSTTEKELSQFLQGAWVAFARDSAQGLVNIGWPQYTPNTTTLAQIGNFFNQTGITFTQGQLLDEACNSLPTLLNVEAQLITLLGPVSAGF
ncbi:hypothetical protein C0992_011662 [Termitomyces sp. T32_za158]|nr:hypothetical protein C0992_011662 [Termitomyces sp. T32_za158]